MAVIGIGTDIVRVSRVRRILRKFPETFAERILHPDELQVFASHHSPASFTTKRFAAKEAAAKALGTGIAKGVSFHDISVTNNEQGQPILRFYGKTLEIAEQMGVKNRFISLSDEGEYAIAHVVLES